MTLSEADYLDILDLIQAAAFEPAAWESVLRRLAGLTGCVAGGLTVENAGTREGSPLVYFGFDAGHVAKTFAHYLPMNPLFDIAPQMQPGFIVTNGDVVPLGEFQRSEFYHGWARPQGLCCPVTVVLHRQDQTYCPLTLVRADGTGDVGAEQRGLLARLSPHLVRAMRVGHQLDLLRQRQSALETVLERLAVAVILLDRRQRVVFANPAAEALLRSGAALATAGGVLTATAPRSNRALREAFSRAATGEPGAGGEIGLEREGRPPLFASLLPLGADHPLRRAAGAARCAVLVGDPEALRQSRSAAVARRYGLTPAESRLLDAMLNGGGLAQTAAQAGVSVTTARTHLQRIFEKTGTHRQGELIHLVMASTPVLPPWP